MPHGTPAEIVSRLGTELGKALATPEVKARLEDFGLEVLPSDGPALAAFLERERRSWHALISQRGLRP